MIREAAQRGCQVVVLPECLDLGWTHPTARTLAEPIPGPRAKQLADAARTENIVVAAGLTERDGDRIYNAAILIDRDGRLVQIHRKINVLDIAQDLYDIGDRLGVAQTTAGIIGVNICADNFPNTLDIGQALGRMGAELLVSPCAWAVDADHDNSEQPYGELWRGAYGWLAPQFSMPIIGASNIGPITAGPWSGRKCIGCSLIVDAHGAPVATGPYDEEALIEVELSLIENRPRGTNISGNL
jgi:predicted amidohydrolase